MLFLPSLFLEIVLKKRLQSGGTDVLTRTFLQQCYRSLSTHGEEYSTTITGSRSLSLFGSVG
jgi:hypothetical protein